jgi:membrane-associated protease RseP (regulator of RpoE activity)
VASLTIKLLASSFSCRCSRRRGDTHEHPVGRAGAGLVIFFHELGHFAVAKWCDVNVERFSIGFGPILWSFKRGETEYALSLIPFGGYVKMLGQDDMDATQMTNEEIAQDPQVVFRPRPCPSGWRLFPPA